MDLLTERSLKIAFIFCVTQNKQEKNEHYYNCICLSLLLFEHEHHPLMCQTTQPISCLEKGILLTACARITHSSTRWKVHCFPLIKLITWRKKRTLVLSGKQLRFLSWTLDGKSAQGVSWLRAQLSSQGYPYYCYFEGQCWLFCGSKEAPILLRKVRLWWRI